MLIHALRVYGRKLIRKFLKAWPNIIIVLLSSLITLMIYIIMQDFGKLKNDKNVDHSDVNRENLDVKPWIEKIKSGGKLTWSMDQFVQNRKLVEGKGSLKENDVLPTPVRARNQRFTSDNIQQPRSDNMPMIGNVNNGKVGVPRMLGKHANNALIKDNLVKKAAFLDPAHQLNQLPMIGQANHQQYGQNNQQYGQNNQQYGRNNQQYGGNNQQYGQNYHQIVQNNAPKIRDRLPPNRALIAEANHNLNYSEYWINHVTLQHKRGYSVEKSEKARVIENSKTDGGAEAAYFAWLMEKQLGCYPRDLHQFGNGVNQWTMCNTGRLALEHPCIVYSFGKTDFEFENGIGVKFQCQIHVFDINIENFAAHSLSDNTHFHAIGLWDDDIDTRNVRDISLNQLSTIIKQTGHGNMMIDLLKIDIDNILWNVLPSIKDGCWKRVKQLIIRVYGPGDGLQVPSVQKMYRILAQVERFGFLKYNVQPCPKQKIVSKFTNNLLFPCFDISYVNKPYIG